MPENMFYEVTHDLKNHLFLYKKNVENVSKRAVNIFPTIISLIRKQVC